ncbi:MAG: inorganic phosphate transporter [Thermoplasmata archaeon]|nr:inorganic phosphate transporter [Thermoplasmata archaeon]
MLMVAVLLIAIIAALYMAWNIGANDVANSMGTSVGSGALTLRGAILVAAICEFSGSVLVGKHVTSTIAKGIADPALIDPNILMLGMLASLIAAGIWVTLATYFSVPVSTTHSIVGAVIGFLLLYNLNLIHWNVVGDIVASWVLSPLSGMFVAYILFYILKITVLSKRDPLKEAKLVTPFFVFFSVSVITMSVIYKGLKNLNLDLGLKTSLLLSLILGALGGLISHIFMRRYANHSDEREDRYKKLERFFIYLQIMTASSVAFAHGANDVANAVGPLVTIVDIYNNVSLGGETYIPLWVLALGGLGIVIGISTWGYKVIYTIGKRITEITPTRGFAAELATAFVVLVFSKLGMPISTSHVIVGSVIGVGFARGLATVDYRVIKNIIYSWIITLPVAMGFSAGIFLLLKFIFI